MDEPCSKCTREKPIGRRSVGRLMSFAEAEPCYWVMGMSRVWASWCVASGRPVRAALGAPWFFQGKEEARHYAKIAEPWEHDLRMPSLTARFDILLAHARQFEAQWGSQQFRRMRKHL